LSEAAAPAPRISVVIPATRGADGVEASLGSLTGQGYAALDALVIEGGAEPYALVEKGFARTSGEILAWLPPGDAHFAWTLRAVAEVFATFPEVAWISSLHPAEVDADGVCSGLDAIPGFSRAAFLDGRLVDTPLQEPATFFRRSLWERAGARFPPPACSAGVALWARFYLETELVGVAVPLAWSRVSRLDPVGRLEAARVLDALRARVAHQRSRARDLALRLGFPRVPWLGPLVDARLGYAGKRLRRPLFGPGVGRFELEDHAFT
jgi:hypothetical protein